MATGYKFDNKVFKQPTVAIKTTSDIDNSPQSLDSGGALIILLKGDGFPGILEGNFYKANGVICDNIEKGGKKSIARVNTLSEASKHISGGLAWQAIQKMFLPSVSQSGISSLEIISGATTTKGTAELNFTDNDTPATGTEGGTFTFETKFEGKGVNGLYSAEPASSDTTKYLTAGYAFSIVKEAIGGTDHLRLLVWEAQYRGGWATLGGGKFGSNNPFDKKKKDSTPRLLFRSSPHLNFSSLAEEVKNDSDLAEYFYISSTAKTTDALPVAAINTRFAAYDGGYVLVAGATETYDDASKNAALEAVSESRAAFIMCIDEGSAVALAPESLLIAGANNSDFKYKKTVYIGGVLDTTLAQSVNLAKTINNQYTTFVPDGYRDFNGSNEYTYMKPTAKAAMLLGIEASLPTQVPMTFKATPIQEEINELSSDERDIALDAGLLVTFYDEDFERNTILKGVNTLQENNFLVNPDGSSHSKQIIRIVNQLNKELVVNAKVDLFGNPQGVNRNTLSAADVTEWTKGYLTNVTATEQDDNMILSFRNVTTTVQGDAYFVSFEIQPNFEVSFIFMTSILIDPQS